MSAAGVEKLGDPSEAQDLLEARVVRTGKGPQEAGAEDGVRRAVAVEGDFAKSRAEWVCSDGLGAYASSTIALMHTKRRHGLLVASHPTLREPHVFLSHVDVTLQFGGRSISLATHQFPGIEPTRGYEYLALFTQDPLPRWVFHGSGWQFERTLGLVRGANAVVLRHEWRGARPVIIEMRPLLAMRPATGLTREHGGFVHRVRLHSNDAVVHPVRALPRVVFRYEGRFVGSPDWWRQFEYLGEHRPGGVREDLWTPGVFRVELQPGDAAYLVCGVDGVPQNSPNELLRDVSEYHTLPRPGRVSCGSRDCSGSRP